MSDDKAMLPFEGDGRLIRRQWVNDRWYFSVVDVVAVLTDSDAPRKYWSAMKARIQDEGFRELLTLCEQLKLPSSDGKSYTTDCADFATTLSLIHVLPALKRSADREYRDQNIVASSCGIYAIINTCTNERYIGSSRDIPKRFAQHKALLRRGKHHASRLQVAWDTYGEAAFDFVVLEELPTSAQLVVVEQYYLDAEQPDYMRQR